MSSDTPTPGTIDRSHEVQLHLTLPYKIEARKDRRVREYLDRGYRIVELLRLTDREALITLTDAPWTD